MRSRNQFYSRHNLKEQRIIIKNTYVSQSQIVQANSNFEDWDKLRQLWIKSCKLKDLSLLKLFLGLPLACLRELYLTDNRISSYGAQVIACADIPHLQILYLDQNRIGDQGLRWLNKGNWLLKCLKLSQNNITVEGMREFYKGNWRDMHYAYFVQNQVSLIELLSVCRCYDMNNGKLVNFIIFNPLNRSEPIAWQQIMMQIFNKQQFQP